MNSTLNDATLAHIPPKLLQIGQCNKRAFEDILLYAHENKLRDIYITSYDHVRGRLNNNKVLITNETLNNNQVEALLSEAVPTLNRIYTGRSTNPNYVLVSPNNKNDKYNFRICVTKFSYGNEVGIDCAIRPLPDKPKSVEELGISPKIVEHLEKMEQGLILVIGATGSGKTSTIAALQRHTLEQPSHIRILEFARPVENLWHKVKIHHSNQIVPHNVSEDGKNGDMESYEEAISTSMRKAGDWLSIGEMTEVESFKASIEMANTGHKVSSTMHANRISAAIARIYNKFPASERDALIDNLIEESGILISQRLYEDTNNGLVACREVLLLDFEIKDSLRQAAAISLGTLRNEINRWIWQQGTSYYHSALELLKAGRITEETFNKVVHTYGKYTPREQ
ncbi:ATPase, T2SS/T4P/T4SS family [Vibrio sp. Hal054]|uniref:ATPase, T2SS/T4P/T4SS family n=1 Tax=Vibrio sp. Hal054 TaxID=3035158 RepID=UPI00301C956B